MSSSNTDSTAADSTMRVAPAVTDTMTTMPADTMRVDSASTPAMR